MDATGKIVVVSGGFGALGRAVCQAFTAVGAQVAALDKAPCPADPGAGVRGFGGVDLSDPKAASAATADIHKAFGRIDVLVNVAGGFDWQTVESGDLETWDRLYAMNIRTAVATSKAALNHLPAGGAIVNVAAAAALKATAGMGAYAASKSGVIRLTEALAEEMKARGVRVNAVLPTIIDTPANRAAMPDADFDRWVRPSDLADCIVFLASNRAVTGAALVVGGGP